MNCINLKERYGRRFKVATEEILAKSGERPRSRDPWLMILLCEHGHFFPNGGDLLGFATDKSGRTATKLRKLAFAEVVQDGDDGVNVVFPVERFDEVARIVHPRRRRRMSEEQRQTNADRLRKYHPSKGQTVHDLARQSQKSGRKSTPRPKVV